MNDLFYLGVKAVITNDSGQILLLKTKDYWDLPGGRIQVGETEAQALVRELTEETGLNATVGQYLGMHLSGARLKADGRDSAGLIFSVYRCEAADSAVMISKEHVGYEWVAPQAASEKLSSKFGPAICEAIAAK